MGTIATRGSRRGAWTLAVLGLFGVGQLAWPSTSHAQAKPADHAKHAAAAKAGGGDEALVGQLRELREKVAAIESALSRGQRSAGSVPASGMGGMVGGTADGARVAAGYQDCARCHQTRPSGPLPQSHLEKPSSMRMGAMPQGGGMPMMGDRGMGTMRGGGGIGMMDEMGMGMSGQGGMGSAAPAGMTEDDAMTGMGAMGKAKGMGMGHMKMSSSLPGFPGASHLYHIGAAGFFLDHDLHITLTADQRTKLNRIKEKALLGGSSCDRKVEEAEQELWELTASDKPDAGAIEAKVREIEKLRGDQRLAFIRAVGEAASELTEEQRRVLVGAGAASDTKH